MSTMSTSRAIVPLAIAPLLISPPAIADVDSDAAHCQIWNQTLRGEAAHNAELQAQVERMLLVSAYYNGTQADAMLQGMGQRQANLLQKMADAGCSPRRH